MNRKRRHRQCFNVFLQCFNVFLQCFKGIHFKSWSLLVTTVFQLQKFVPNEFLNIRRSKKHKNTWIDANPFFFLQKFTDNCFKEFLFPENEISF